MSDQAMKGPIKAYCEHRCMKEDGHDGGHWYGYVVRSAEVPVRDRLARALFESGNGLPEGWDDLTEDVRDYWRAYASARRAVEQRYSQAYQALVRSGLKPQVRGKYR